MKFKFKDTSLNVETGKNNPGAKGYIFFIHGFTGSAKDWDEIIPIINKDFSCAAIDVIGHGSSGSPDNLSYYKIASIIEQINFIISRFTDEQVILAGYSMGGRIALNFAITNPDKVRALILESSSAGIEEVNLRHARIASDEKLIDLIEENPIDKFVDYWMNIDLFASQRNLPSDTLKKIREIKLKNNKTGLVNSLRGFGAGAMKPLHNELKNFRQKTLLITGELDKKYCMLNSEMIKLFPSAKHFIIKNAGHNAHLEQPSKYADLINTFLSEF